MSAKNHKPASVLFSLIVFFAVGSFFLDGIVLVIMPALQAPSLDSVFLLITHIGFALGLFVALPFIILLMRKEVSEALYILTAAASSSLIGMLLKMVVATERPSQDIFVFSGPLVNSFPSLHALLVFAMLPLLAKHFQKWKYLFSSMAILVAFTRLYFGVHHLSDVVWGALLGYGIGWYVAQDHSESKLNLSPLEMRRKIFHVVLGIVLATLVFFDYLNALRIGIILAVGIALSFIEKKQKLPFLSLMLDLFERVPERKSFPAKGMLMFIAGVFLAVLIFPKNIALASIMVLTLGDAAAHIFGVHFGNVRSPLAEHRFIEGAFAGIIAGFFGALFFVPPLHALVAATAAMLVEAIEFNIPKLQVDDNLLIPLMAGASLLLMGMA